MAMPKSNGVAMNSKTSAALVTKQISNSESATATEAVQAGPVLLETGSFQDADSFHKGSGQATIYRGSDGSHLLRLENLNVTNGPDLDSRVR